jgi:hypothetical protein
MLDQVECQLEADAGLEYGKWLLSHVAPLP